MDSSRVRGAGNNGQSWVTSVARRYGSHVIRAKRDDDFARVGGVHFGCALQTSDDDPITRRCPCSTERDHPSAGLTAVADGAFGLRAATRERFIFVYSQRVVVASRQQLRGSTRTPLGRLQHKARV